MNYEEFNAENDEFLSDEDDCETMLLRYFGAEYHKYLDQQDDNDYVINPPQWQKLLSVLQYFLALAKKSNGKVEPSQLQPKLCHGGVTAYFIVMQLQENDIPAFCEALLKTSAVSIDATLDGHICVSVCVPNVFVRKDEIGSIPPTNP